MITALDRTETQLGRIAGASNVIADEATCSAVTVDGKTPRLIVFPSDSDQVAEILRYAAEERLAVIPFRNRTKLGLGNPPREYDIALSLKNMNRVWHYEPDDLTISAEPGMKFGDFQRFVGRHQLWLPLSPAGGDQASLGGIVASNSTGTYRSRFGTPRDMVLGMKIASTEGKVIKTGGRVVKNVAGYDLTKLMIGSLGTLGVITEINFKLYPFVAHRSTCVLTAGTLEKARKVRRAIQLSPVRPLRIAMADAGCMEFLKGAEDLRAAKADYQFWIENGGSSQVLARCAAELKKIAAQTGETFGEMGSGKKADDLWHGIENPHFDARNDAKDWLLKIAIPAAAIEEFLGRARMHFGGKELSRRCIADPLGGVVRLWLSAQTDPAGVEAWVSRLRKDAEGLGGSMCVEVAPVDAKSRMDAWGTIGDDFEIMRKMKDIWDPKRILSPGRFVGGL